MICFPFILLGKRDLKNKNKNKKKLSMSRHCRPKVKWIFFFIEESVDYAYFNGIHCPKRKDTTLLIQQD